MTALWFLPFLLQGLVMGVDEFGFHRRRVLPRGEWIGHALDTFGFLACLACPLLLPPSAGNLGLFALLGAASCLMITKDEFIHQRLCSGGEHWVHAVLFLLHPIVLIATAGLWLSTAGTALTAVPTPDPALAMAMLRGQVLGVYGFLVFQILYWASRSRAAEGAPVINNQIYDELGERWYRATDDPVALLRAESRLRTAWVLAELQAQLGSGPLAILDVACGGGFLANPLALAGHGVTGIDLSQDSLNVAKRHDGTGSVAYLAMDARRLTFADGQFDAVCMMDFLEHLEERDAVIREAARVLKPGGLFFFHTFNRTPLSGLVAIKGVEWFVKNTPKHMHLYRLFLKPAELQALCRRHHLVIGELRGVRPRVWTLAFLKLLFTGRVSEEFQFEFTRSQRIGYCGRARKFA